MKVVHTSDWHLGQQLYNYDREEEQLDMLRQLEEIVKYEQPDALLVSGDVYHTAQPSAKVQTMFSNAITNMHKLCPNMSIIITAGNHDSGTKHEIFRSPWESMNVYTIGHIDREHPQKHIIKIGEKGYVIAVPYVSNRNLPDFFYQNLLDEAKSDNTNHLPIVLMAHTTVAGVDLSGHEGATPASVGGIDALPLSDFGQGYDYLALGHIHRGQWVEGSCERARYSGTPLAVSFDETFRHTLSIIELGASGEKALLRETEISNIHPLVTLPVNGALPWEEVRDLLEHFKPEREGSYLRLAVKVNGFLQAGANIEAQQLADKCGCRFCYILSDREHTEQADDRSLNIDEFQRESPEDIAKRYVECQGASWDEEMEAMFREVVELVEEGARSQ